MARRRFSVSGLLAAGLFVFDVEWLGFGVFFRAMLFAVVVFFAGALRADFFAVLRFAVGLVFDADFVIRVVFFAAVFLLLPAFLRSAAADFAFDSVVVLPLDVFFRAFGVVFFAAKLFFLEVVLLALAFLKIIIVSSYGQRHGVAVSFTSWRAL